MTEYRTFYCGDCHSVTCEIHEHPPKEENKCPYCEIERLKEKLAKYESGVMCTVATRFLHHIDCQCYDCTEADIERVRVLVMKEEEND